MTAGVLVPGVLVVGDVGHDAYSDEPSPRPGGCALNVACALAAEGHPGPVAVAGPVGPDGAWLADEARRRGVDASLVDVRPSGATPIQRIVVKADGERDFSGGYAPGVLAGWSPPAALEAALDAAALVYVPVFDRTLDLARRVLDRRAGEGPAGRARRPVAIDLMNLTDVDDAFVADAVLRASVVFAGLDRERHAPAVARLADLARRPAAALVVVTLGPRGALAFARDAAWSIPAPPVPGGRVVDTTGCGDSFAGALLAARARGLGLPAALERAGLRAARVAAQRGALLAGPR